ncbi:hypothetical protein DIPPA_33635 [Diplonema papillatum]|nr:hypothetical protein DIPPA_33635 [Diplonema papillatum]
MWCPCSKAYREAVAGGREPAAIPPRTPAEPSGGAPGAAGQEGYRGGAIPFTFEEVATAGIRPLERVPAAAKPQVSALFETVLRAATDDAGWLRAYAFAPLVLATTHRGGRKAVTEALRRRVRLWRAGQLDTLWAEARAVSAGKAGRRARRRTYPVADDVDNRLELQTDVESVDDLDGATVRQVLRRARDRCYSRAVSALSAAQTAPADDATLAALMELHPCLPLRSPVVRQMHTGAGALCDPAALCRLADGGPVLAGAGSAPVGAGSCASLAAGPGLGWMSPSTQRLSPPRPRERTRTAAELQPPEGPGSGPGLRSTSPSTQGSSPPLPRETCACGGAGAWAARTLSGKRTGVKDAEDEAGGHRLAAVPLPRPAEAGAEGLRRPVASRAAKARAAAAIPAPRPRPIPANDFRLTTEAGVPTGDRDAGRLAGVPGVPHTAFSKL